MCLLAVTLYAERGRWAWDATGIFGKALGRPTEAAGRTVEKVKVAFARIQPIPRAGLPDDIAHAAVFLASDEASRRLPMFSPGFP